MQLHDKRVVEPFQDHPFDHSVLSLVFAEYHILFKRFHSVVLAILFVADQIHLAEGASPNNFNYFEIVHAHSVGSVVFP